MSEETEREARELLKPHEFRVWAKTNYGSEEHSAVDYWGAVKVLADALAALRPAESETEQKR